MTSTIRPSCRSGLGPASKVSRSLGHSSIAITADTYGHLTDDAAASAVAKVAEALGV